MSDYGGYSIIRHFSRLLLNVGLWRFHCIIIGRLMVGLFMVAIVSGSIVRILHILYIKMLVRRELTDFNNEISLNQYIN